ncbi:Putative 30S ribosomal protein S17P-like protein [Fusarium oxysporum f. sp. cubense race 1]|uniref:Putative 30S ribosomal protein S17P-like protein n=1 Tax=Fusarium oxysporum f. sp. cubense (strain race 1) TaxID=1229664 RepID=N4U6U8_FUSC1|nr:Putative 30S ribosomal protein S17P-like protein [Fusarium oxysporum f. sp. cubense race 1]
MLFDLSIQAYEVYKDSGRIKDINAAVDFARGCDDKDCHDSQALPDRLNYLAFLLTVKYKRLGGTENIEEAINVARQAVHLTPQGHPELAKRVTELGNGLAVRFSSNDDMSDLIEAVKWAKQAVELTPSDHPDRASWLNNFGNRLATVYERNGDVANLDEAIKVLGESVESTPTGHPNMAGRMNNLANCFSVRYRTVHAVADIQEAVKAARSAVKLLPADFPNRGIWLNNLCVSLLSIFDRKGEIDDLEESIQAAREAVESTAPEDTNLAIFLLGTLGLCFSSKYGITKDTNDLEQAISFTKTALRLIPSDHPSRTRWLSNLGKCFQDRFLSQNDSADLEEASTCLEDAWHCQSAVPFQRVQAAARCLRLLFKLGKIESAAKLGKAVIELLPVINTNTLDLNDRQFIVQGFYSIGSDVCSSLLSLQQSVEALQNLERGRAFAISNLIDRRRDLSPLREKCPALASRYEKLQGDLYAPLGCNLAPDQQCQHGERQSLLTEFNDCVREIRNLPSYERFLLGQTVSEMQDSASGGTIIIVNVTGLRSDAILVYLASDEVDMG